MNSVTYHPDPKNPIILSKKAKHSRITSWSLNAVHFIYKGTLHVETPFKKWFLWRLWRSLWRYIACACARCSPSPCEKKDNLGTRLNAKLSKLGAPRERGRTNTKTSSRRGKKIFMLMETSYYENLLFWHGNIIYWSWTLRLFLLIVLAFPFPTMLVWLCQTWTWQRRLD